MNQNTITITNEQGEIKPELLERINIGLSLMSKASDIPFTILINYIRDNFPSISLLNIPSISTTRANIDIFKPLLTTVFSGNASTITFNRPSLNLNFVGGISKSKDIQAFRQVITSQSTSSSSTSSRTSRRTTKQEFGKYMSAGAKAKIVNSFNSFVKTKYWHQ